MTTLDADPLTSLPSFGAPTILSNGDELVYWWTDDGETTLRVYDHEADETETVPINTDVVSPEGWEPIYWLGDRFLIQIRPNVYLLDREGNIEEFSLESHYTNIIDIDSSARRYLYVYYPEGVGPSDDPWTLRIYDQETDSTTVLTDHPEQWGHAGFSPDDEWIAYRENPTETFGEDQLVVADIDGDRERTFHIGDAASRTQLYGWHPNGRQLLLNDRSSGWYRVGLHNWQTDETTWFGSDRNNEFPLTILPAGERLITTRFRNGGSTAGVYTLHDERPRRELNLPEGVVDRRTRQAIGTALSSDHVLLKHETATRPPCLLSYNLATDEVTTIVDTRTAALEEADLVEAEYITYESTDGLAVNAVLHRAPRSPSPAVVKIHGGPTTAVYRGFDPFAQVLVSEGFTVLQPNYRGSTDQDRAFEEAIRGDSAEGAVDDVAEGARWLADKEWIDADGLAAFGHSAGADNAAMQSIRHPDLWQVVIPENGGLNKVKILGNPNQYALRRIIEDPEVETQEEYLSQRSPVHRTEDVGCPVCVIQGENDAVEMSQEFIDGLKERGWTEGEEFRFEVIEGEGHVITDKERLWSLVVEVLNTHTAH